MLENCTQPTSLDEYIPVLVHSIEQLEDIPKMAPAHLYGDLQAMIQAHSALSVAHILPRDCHHSIGKCDHPVLH